MVIKIGDKVRFLNTTGGGIVKRFISKDLVSVEEEDGFDVPVLIKDCVVIETVKTQDKIQPINKNVIQNQKNEITTSPKIIETKHGNLINVALAFLPIDHKNIQNSSYETYIVNDSNYYLQYSYLSKKDQNWILRQSNTVEPNQQLFVEEFGKDQLNDLERVCVQLSFYKIGKPFELKQPLSIEFRLDAVKFYKLHSFQENDYFEDNALMQYLVKNDQPIRSIEIKADELIHAMKMKNNSEKIVEKKQPNILPNSILEIDLHINELLDNYSGLSNSEIIKIQINKFNDVMKENIRLKNKKIVFIHGKGEGVLRKAILDELKLKYRTCLFQDASFREYGFGATMVIIK